MQTSAHKNNNEHINANSNINKKIKFENLENPQQ